MAGTVLVTGASSGIGRATALRFISAGWNVVATARRLAAITIAPTDKTLILPLDVTAPAQIRAAIDQAEAAFGGVDVIVSSAGYAEAGVFEGISADKVRASFETNFFGIMNVMRIALPLFRTQQGGMFINIGAAAGRVGLPGLSVHSAAKFALEGFSESIWFELAALGIAIKLIEPGVVETPFLTKLAARRRANLSPREYARFDQHNDSVGLDLQKVRSTPEEIASVIFGAATDGSSQLRYSAGESMAHLVHARLHQDDERYEIFMRSEMNALLNLPIPRT